MVAPNPVAFTIFGIDIMWYGVFIGLGIILGAGILYIRAPKYGISGDRIIDFLIFSIPAGIVGARLYYVAFNWEYYAGDFMRIINTRGGGLAIHGGLIFGLLTAAVLCRIYKVKALDLVDLAVPSIALAQAFGRWGNFFNEEAHGGPTDFPINVLIDGQTYHATFLYESVWCLVLFILLSYMLGRRKFPGQIFLLYGILYSLERFFVEALRTDSLMIGMFKQAQVISLSIIVVCLVCYIILYRRAKEKIREDVVL